MVEVLCVKKNDSRKRGWPEKKGKKERDSVREQERNKSEGETTQKYENHFPSQ